MMDLLKKSVLFNGTESLNSNLTQGSGNITCCEAPGWSSSFVVAYMCIIIVIGLPGNGLVVLILSGIRNKFSTEYYILTMAIFDFLCSGLNTPLYIVRNVPAAWGDYASHRYCQIHSTMLYMTILSSTLFLTAIAVDRYVVTCRPHGSTRSVRNKRSIYVSVTVAGVSFAYAVGLGSTMSYSPVTKGCIFLNTTGLVMAYVIAAMFVGLFITAVFCYTKISLALRQQQKIITAQRQRIVQLNRSMELEAVVPKNTINAGQRCFPFNKTNNSVSPTTINTKVKTVNIASPSDQEPPKATDMQSEANLTRQSILTNSPSLTHHEHYAPPTLAEPQNSLNTGRTSRTSDTRIIPFMHHSVVRPKSQTNTRITLIVFLLSTVYVLTWIINWVCNVIEIKTEFQMGLVHIFKKLFMVNCITNPIFYVLLSSKFRERVRGMCKSRK